jgi:hypothetical protein
MALIAAGSGVAAYLNTVDANRNVLLGAALLTFSVWPYTLLAVMPTNEQLLDGDGMFCTIFSLTNALQKTNAFETNIPRKGIANATVPVSTIHIHVSVSDSYVPTIDLPILLQEICAPILGIYKSLIDT